MASSHEAPLGSRAPGRFESSVGSSWEAIGRFLRLRGPELGIVLFGIVVRVWSIFTYKAQHGYDFIEHSATADWWAHHFEMPPFLLSRGSYHPQPYYVMCGLIRRLGGSWQAVQASSVVFGSLRLCLLWFALERYLPRQRVARWVTLFLAATIPVSVMMDAMITQEPLNNLLSLAFVVATLELARAPEARRLRCGVLLGLVGAAGLLVKVSNLVLLGFLGLAALLELVQRLDLRPYERLRRTVPWLLAIGIASVVSSPQYIYNQTVIGKAFLDGWYKRPTEDTTNVHAERHAILDRRTIGFVLGFNADLVRRPYAPSGTQPAPRFWPTLIGTSYSDYFGYRFSPPTSVPPKLRRGLGIHGKITSVARAAQASGLGIALVTVVAWLVAAYQTTRRRELARPLLLSLPLLGVVGAGYFATQYPYDFEGVIKGHYYHFVTPPLYVLFGVGTAWLLKRRLTRIFGVASCLCLLAPAAYSLLCVFR